MLEKLFYVNSIAGCQYHSENTSICFSFSCIIFTASQSLTKMSSEVFVWLKKSSYVNTWRNLHHINGTHDRQLHLRDSGRHESLGETLIGLTIEQQQWWWSWRLAICTMSQEAVRHVHRCGFPKAFPACQETRQCHRQKHVDKIVWWQSGWTHVRSWPKASWRQRLTMEAKKLHPAIIDGARRLCRWWCRRLL